MKDQTRLLVVDDEPHIRRVLQVALEKEGYVVDTAEDAYQAEKKLAEGGYAVVLSDVAMPGRSGYELLRSIRQAHPGLSVVIMTAFGTIPAAVQAIRDGAFEYITKPFDLETVKRIVANAVEAGAEGLGPDLPAQAEPPVSVKRGGRSRPGAGDRDFIAVSSAMQGILETVRQVADSRATVLITGESGSGKEVVARTLHNLSSRAKAPFVAVSCAALPESLLESELFGYEKGAFTGAQGSKPGRFEMANAGTLFLDEIGEIPLATQVKLLRVLQEREFERLGGGKPIKVDVRLVAATNRDLLEAVDQGVFRLDLYYRLQVVEIRLPALRERPEDILPLARHFLQKFAAENGRPVLSIGKDAEAALLRYAWPGNVRELENTMERVVVLSPKEAVEVSVKALPATILRVA